MYGAIYKIINQKSGSFYIGQTIQTLRQRWVKHVSDARCGKDTVLAAAIRKYGPESFSVELLGIADSKQSLNALEIDWIARLKPKYNLCAGGGGLGSPSASVKAKISKALQGRIFTAETKTKISNGLLGRKLSDASKQKIRNAMLGKSLRKSPIRPEEVAALVARNKARRKNYPKDRAALYEELGCVTRNEKIKAAALDGYKTGSRKRLYGSDNPAFGKKKPPELLSKLSEQFSGVNNPFYGCSHSEDTKAKMREAHKRRPPVECPHCGKVGAANSMQRWHFKNCRSLKS